MTDITPAYKKDDAADKGNYRPVSILPAVSKIFERNMYIKICNSMNLHYYHTYADSEKVNVPNTF